MQSKLPYTVPCCTVGHAEQLPGMLLIHRVRAMGEQSRRNRDLVPPDTAPYAPGQAAHCATRPTRAPRLCHLPAMHLRRPFRWDVLALALALAVAYETDAPHPLLD